MPPSGMSTGRSRGFVNKPSVSAAPPICWIRDSCPFGLSQRAAIGLRLGVFGHARELPLQPSRRVSEPPRCAVPRVIGAAFVDECLLEAVRNGAPVKRIPFADQGYGALAWRGIVWKSSGRRSLSSPTSALVRRDAAQPLEREPWNLCSRQILPLVIRAPRPLARRSRVDKFSIRILPPMQARILLLAGMLIVSGCSKPQVSPQDSAAATPAPAPRLAPEGTVYLLRRVAVATENSLYGLAEGSEVKVIEERSGKLLVEAQGLRFEIDQEYATSDLDQREAVLARAAEREAAYQAAMARRTQTEDKKFLAEEDLQRRNVADAKITHLRNEIAAARDEINRLDAENNESVVGSAEDQSRRRRIAILEADIANCDKEIQILSDSVIAED